MRIIDNIRNNHNQSIQSMLITADQMILASPFLIEEFDEFVHDVAELGVKSIVLLTTLKDDSPDLFKKANSLYSFCTSCVQNSMNFEVRVDNKLHGKIYIASRDGRPIKGIITSANFTDNGLKYSHEWGVEIDDIDLLQNLINDLMRVGSDPLSGKEIELIVKAIDDYSKENPPIREPKLKLEVTKHIRDKLKVTIPKVARTEQIDFPDDTRYFLKPVGSSDHPFEETRKLSETIQEMHFSKRKPNAVRPGDILICYGVGTTKLLGYFRVLNEPFLSPDENTRWPWTVDSENLSPKYSFNWSLFNNTLSSAQSTYGYDKELTYVGGKSLGALNFGADKIRLNESFAHHLINIIEQKVKH
ncbi:phosphatidylserine/phosphatidylglycerophosphate/cardiolipin synthase [Desulfosporosinus acidiphilus SJ4]|uniref:Phosphatidylserine/phosphatidylglycerophosphate/ cardiolipin synthase n=1 Tax=Desulfosporosinus acidiphilus (strain DSM 22704 / JCM 16185 / SJ4) TaxID=646529 RepID=I4DC67_DESAJ|nr:restriction endonuclease PLD domain-containing protein [Desulfosporosinus acidiphilus]AFM43391.1 phosphatidylserine/phosphatidylglycerophosphate/cardiolipin synthase [Desulfosporosinus acidiphilus SJ4]